MRRDLEEQQGLRAQARDLKSKAHDKLLVLRAALCSSVPREEGAGSRGAEGRTDDGVGAGMVDIGDVLGSTWQDPDVISRELIALTEAHEAAGTERCLFTLRHVRHIRLDGWGEGANDEWTVIEAENPWGVERQAAPDGGGEARGGIKHKHTTHTHAHSQTSPPLSLARTHEAQILTKCTYHWRWCQKHNHDMLRHSPSLLRWLLF